MSSAFDDVRFLAASPNRAAVLRALASGPMTRDDLLSRVDASPVTHRRILAEMTERGWVGRRGEAYVATRTGTTIAREFDRFLDTVRVTTRLADAMAWLPTESFGFDVNRLADARVTLPEDTHHIAPVARVDELIRAASEARILSHGVSISTVAASRDAVVEHGQHFELVLPEPAVSYIEDSASLTETFREMADTDGVNVYTTTDTPPEMMIALLDGVAVLGLLGDGLPRGVIESEDEVVCRWARETFEAWRADGTAYEERAPRDTSTSRARAFTP